MESILFDSYRKYQKSEKDNIVKAIFKLPVMAKLLLGAIIISSIIGLAIIFVEGLREKYFYYLVFEAILCIGIYFYTENFQIKTSDARLYIYQSYCTAIKTWLDGLGFIVTVENITEIINRTQKNIALLEDARDKRRNRIDKWIQVLIIPILLAVFSAIIKDQTNLSLLLTYAFAMLIALGSLGLAFFNCYNVVDFFRKRKIEQMKSFAEDLQGILDCCFDNKLIKSIDNEKQNLEA